MTNPNHWFSERRSKHVNLYKLTREELIQELLFERLEYLAFEQELSGTYGFKKRTFPEQG